MTIGQEFIYELEQMAKRQKQVYQDAADFGVEATPEVCKEIREICLCLAADYNSTKNVQTYRTGATRTWTVLIPIEYSDYYPGQMDCLEIKVEKVETTNKRYCDYFTINMKRVRAPQSTKFFKEAA